MDLRSTDASGFIESIENAKHLLMSLRDGAHVEGVEIQR